MACVCLCVCHVTRNHIWGGINGVRVSVCLSRDQKSHLGRNKWCPCVGLWVVVFVCHVTRKNIWGGINGVRACVCHVTRKNTRGGLVDHMWGPLESRQSGYELRL